jgi:hypothetical protein
LSHVWSLRQTNCGLSTCVLINPRFAKSFINTVTDWRFSCVRFRWAVFLVGCRRCMISTSVYSTLNMSGWNRHETTSSFWA